MAQQQTNTFDVPTAVSTSTNTLSVTTSTNPNEYHITRECYSYVLALYAIHTCILKYI